MSEVYLGNPNLKKANTPIEFTEEQIREFLKCKEDPVYFAKNYVKIVSLDEGLVPFSPYNFQEKLIFVRCHDRLVSLQRLCLIYFITLFLMTVLILVFLLTKQQLQENF